MRIEFKKTSEMQTQCAQRVRTNRITRIDERGNVYHEDTCVKGETKRVDTTDKAVDVDVVGGVATCRSSSERFGELVVPVTARRQVIARYRAVFT